MKVKRANLTVLEEPDFVVETEDDDVSDRCYLCLRVMPPLTWRGDEQNRNVCCGNSICKACHVETRRQGDEARRLSDRVKSIRETDPNWRVTLGGMKDQLEHMVCTLEREGTCDLCKGRRPATTEDSFAACMRHAQAGKPWACYLVANKYESGTGVRQDLAEAHRWFEKAATHPEPAVNAFSGLGGSHLKRGNYAEARRWLEKAAAQGHAHAMYMLGRIIMMTAWASAGRRPRRSSGTSVGRRPVPTWRSVRSGPLTWMGTGSRSRWTLHTPGCLRQRSRAMPPHSTTSSAAS